MTTKIAAPGARGRVFRTLRRVLFPDWLLNRKVRTTRTGYVFLAVVIAVAIAAFNTGNNMLYLVLAMMIASLLASFMISENVIALLFISRDAPGLVTEGLSFQVSYRVRNDKKVYPSFAVRISEKLVAEEVAAVIGFVEGGGEITVKGPAIAERRGRIGFHDMTLSTSAPFGWFRKTKRVPLPGEIIVLPRTDPREVDRDMISSLGEQRPIHRKGRGEELFGFRRYERGDPVKDIHWKTTARTGDLMVREREIEEERKLRIVVDLPIKAPAEKDVLREAAVRRAASMAEAAIQDGWQVRVEVRGRGIDYGHGHGHLREIMIFLALFDSPGEMAGKILAPADGQAMVIG